MVWVADRGFASATNRAYLTKGDGHYIHAEKLRHTNTEARASRRSTSTRTTPPPAGTATVGCARNGS
jgi:hypothetical protein